MIIIGYQGIGKSTLSKKSKGFIDLESSNFFHHGKRPDDWYIYYCQIAEHLSEQGYVVFVSSHEPVRNYFVNSNERAIIICPDFMLKDEWIRKLRKRYEEVTNDKNYKAWQNAACRYDDNIKEMYTCGIPVIPIRTMNYDLEQMIRSVIANNPEIDLHCRQIEVDE